MRIRLIFYIIFALFLLSCSKDKDIYTPTVKLDPYKIYKEGLDSFNENQFFFASKKFSEAEINFISPSAAAKSAIMNSFSLYAINFYNEAEESLNRYLKVYPNEYSFNEDAIQLMLNIRKLSNYTEFKDYKFYVASQPAQVYDLTTHLSNLLRYY